MSRRPISPRRGSARPGPGAASAGPGPARSAPAPRGRARLGGENGTVTREKEPRKPRSAISLRALALFVVVLVAFAVVAPTLRYAIAQQEQLRQLRADVTEAEERHADLERRIELWQDPDYVQAQARDRLGFVMPGETPYVVVDPETVTGGESIADAEAAAREAERAAATPWYLRVWETVEIAGESTVGDDDPSGLTVPEPEE